MTAIGIDLGGTKIYGVRLDGDEVTASGRTCSCGGRGVGAALIAAEAPPLP